MKYIIYIVVCSCIVGCGEKSAPDQCLRRDLFQQCLQSLPAGPSSTKYNDWDEVVEQCEQSAWMQSIRKLSSISDDCQP